MRYSSNETCRFFISLLLNSLFLWKQDFNFREKGTLISDGINLKTNFDNDYVEEIETGNGFIEEIEDFYFIVKEGTKVRSTFKEGYKDLKTILDALSI